MSDGGKGSAPRKKQDHVAYDQNYQTIFGESGPLARKKREEALQSLVSMSEELGLYDTPADRNSRKD